MAQQTTTIIPASGVDGNITSCKIENQLKTVKKDSVVSLQQTSTYMTYDVCNRKVITEYQIPEFTPFAIFGVIALIVIGLSVLWAWWMNS